jgi:hypothetical protein
LAVRPQTRAVLAQRSGQSPATMTIGSDLGRKSHAWVARLSRSHDGPASDGEPCAKAGSRRQPFLEGVHFAFHLRLSNVGKNQA